MKKLVLLVCVLCVVGCAVPYSYQWEAEQWDHLTALDARSAAAMETARTVGLEQGAKECFAILEEEPQYATGYWRMGIIASWGGEFKHAAGFAKKAAELVGTEQALWAETDNRHGFRDAWYQVYSVSQECFSSGMTLDFCPSFNNLQKSFPIEGASYADH